jgi:hypothetical protein
VSLVNPKVYRLRQILENEGLLPAAKFVHPKPFESASTVLVDLLHLWLAQGKLHNAATMLWGPNKFTPEPILVQDTWESIKADSKLIVIGAGSVGKSYNFAIWTLLDWIQDPDHTFVQCLSVSKQHAKTNVFAHLKDLHRDSIIPLPGEVKGESIASPSASDKAGILLRAIAKGEQGFGALRGFHPHPRAIPHPTFGKLSRIRLLLDEAEEIPVGIWEGVNNLLVSESENPEYKGQIKVFAATNPKNRLSELGKRCEPLHGWNSIKADRDHCWVSKLGWRVQRLDAARSENVIERRDVYQGMQTWKGYQSYLALGVDNPEYWTMARGWFPEQGVFGTIIPPNLIESSKGTWIFNSEVTNAGGVDLAFAANGDNVMFSSFKYGYADSFRLPDGKIQKLDKYRWVMQFEDVFPLQKQPTLELCETIKALCASLSIKPDWLACDSTGNGKGVFDVLTSVFGPVHGVDYCTGSTHTKVLDEDQLRCDEVYDGVVTELYFGPKKLMESGYLKLNPNGNFSQLYQELTGRKFFLKGQGKVRVQSKDDYKSEGNKSPDCFVVGTMITTPSGPVKIEQLKPGDLVVTPFGAQPIIAIHKHASADLYEATFSDGVKLKGKGNHKVFTWDKGWVELKKLSFTSVIESAYNIPIWNILKLLFIKAKPSGFKQQVDTISPMTSVRLRDFYIDEFLPTNLGRFLKEWWCITKTGTGGTIEFQILNSCLRRRMPACIRSSYSKILSIANAISKCWLTRKRGPRFGTSQLSGVSGTAKMRFKAGQINQRNSVRAKFAASLLWLTILSYALLNALIVKCIFIFRKPEHASYAARLFKLISTRRRRVAVAHVEPSAGGLKDVYNLTLLKHNAYYANGVLVANCGDSFTLGCHAIRMMAVDFTPALLPVNPNIYAKEPVASSVDVNNFISFND